MHPLLKVAGITLVATAAAVGLFASGLENGQKEEAHNTHKKTHRAGSGFHDDILNEDENTNGSNRKNSNRGSSDSSTFEEERSEEEIRFDGVDSDMTIDQPAKKDKKDDEDDEDEEDDDRERHTLTHEEYETTVCLNMTTENRPTNGATIGIDLGTSSSSVGVWQDGNVLLIPNEHGDTRTPSCVRFTSRGGDAGNTSALEKRNPRNTVFGTKRLLGRTYTDHGVQEDAERWPFSLFPSDYDIPTIQVDSEGIRRRYVASDISTMLLMKMKRIAEDHLGQTVTNAVVTVPPKFNDVQRQAMRDAASNAGLNVLRLMNETTAAAVAYVHQRIGLNGDTEKTVLVFDLGGGSLDVSLLTIGCGIVEVEATDGDSRLGGDDFDNCMLNYILEQIQRDWAIDVSKNHTFRNRIRMECERVKRSLSILDQTTFYISFDSDDLYYKETITRQLFESLCEEHFSRCLHPIEKVLNDANGFSKSDVDEIVLIGGSTRIPKIKQLLRDFFNNKDLCDWMDADEAVAYGATVQATILSNKTNVPEELNDFHYFDVTSFSLGLETDEGEMTTMIKQKTTYPYDESTIFTTNADNVTSVSIKIFEGESCLTHNNNFLGDFRLDDIPPMPRGVPQIEVIFDIDDDGILSVSAVEKSTGKENKLTIKGDLREVNIVNRCDDSFLTKYNPM